MSLGENEFDTLVLDHMVLIDIYRICHPKVAEYLFFSSAHGKFSNIYHMLGHKVGVNVQGYQNHICPMADVALWTGFLSVNQRITGSVPNWGTCLVCGPSPQLAHEKQPHIDVSLPLFLPPFPSLDINKIFK